MAKKLSYEELRDTQQKEKKSPYLTELRANFYKVSLDRIKELEREYQQEDTKDKSSSKLAILKSELNNSRLLVDEIYKRRENKIIKLALSALRGGSPEIKPMLSPERELFEKIRIFLEEARKKILSDKKDIERKDIKKKDATEEIKEKAVPKEHFKQEEKKSSSFVVKETEIVRITKDLPSFVGADMQTYSLKREDVVTLPKNTAEILIKQGNALRVCLQ